MANEKRLIDANTCCDKCGMRNRECCSFCIVGTAPTVDAEEVVHGRWLSAYEYALKLGVTDKEKLEETKKDKWWKFCNDCEQPVKGFHNYCPNCGAKMDGEEKDSNLLFADMEEIIDA